MIAKSCGNCVFFGKKKNWWTGGLCDFDDSVTTSDKGRNCPDWKGVKYSRTKEKNYVVD